METRHKHNKPITKDTNEFSFSKEEDLIMLLNAIFKYGYSNLPSTILPNMSEEERHSALQSALEKAKIAIDKKPSVIEWLNSSIFDNDEYNIPMALLLIGLYELCPLCEQRNEKCNFREIYLFLYKMTTNQIVPYLSHESAEILYKLLSGLIDEVWPSIQPELLQYLSSIHIYSRSEVRRTYSGKKILKKKAAKNCSS
ncbi:uncharacterized protein LOC105252306 [Camponotus floridanus]|uniref:uncharacterized protein LOC105252306 n=1 Tax=Camponotus floridanus TaxID=104421 RepID=UPI00059E6CC0|nr:uncharacterized protein LOC105252306 [Camponotus floridanus]